RLPTLSRTTLARTLISLLLVAAAPALAGCIATGVDAQTNQQYQPVIGSNLRTGQVQLYNALVVDNDDGTATLAAVLANRSDEPQKLDAVSAVTSGGETIEVEAAPAILGPRSSFNTGPAATAVLRGDAVKAGSYVTVTL